MLKGKKKKPCKIKTTLKNFTNENCTFLNCQEKYFLKVDQNHFYYMYYKQPMVEEKYEFCLSR